MAKEKKVHRVPKIKIDLSEWEMGDWPEDLHKLLKVKAEKTSYGTVEIEFDFDEVFAAAARKIVKEGIEAFFGEGFVLRLSEDGIEVIASADDSMEPMTIIPWDTGSVWLKSPATIKVIEKWIKEEVEDSGWDEDDSPARGRGKSGE